MDSELVGREPVKRSHGQVVGTAIVDGKLLCEIVQRIEGMAGIDRDGRARLCRYGAGYTDGRRCRSSIMPRVGFLRRMSLMSFRSASVCWFGWLCGRPPGLTGQGCRTSIPALLPEVAIRPALVVFPTGAADAVFFCVLHERLPVCHVLCYTLVHERYGLLSPSCCVVTQL